MAYDEDSVANLAAGWTELKGGGGRLIADVERDLGVDYQDDRAVDRWTKERRLRNGQWSKPRRVFLSSTAIDYLKCAKLIGEAQEPGVMMRAVTMMCRALREASILASKSKHQASRIENAYEIMDSGVDLAAVYVLDAFGSSRMDVLCLAPLHFWREHPNEDLDLRC